MTTQDYTNLIESLKSIPHGNSESENRNGMVAAMKAIRLSGLPEADKEQLRKTICLFSNPSGYYFDSNGTYEAIKALRILRANVCNSKGLSPVGSTKPLKLKRGQVEGNTQSPMTVNRHNLKRLVLDGRIFSVVFAKLSTGESRTMKARMGVKKHLRGGYKSYNSDRHNLLTVFDMDAKGYRSIPVEAIHRLSVGGQTFDFMAA